MAETEFNHILKSHFQQPVKGGTKYTFQKQSSPDTADQSEIVDLNYRYRAVETFYGDVYSEIIKLENKVRKEREKIKELRSV